MKKKLILIVLTLAILIPLNAAEYETSFTLRDDALYELYPNFSFTVKNNNLEYGFLFNENEIIIPISYRPDYWAVGFTSAFDFRYGYDFYLYGSGKYEALFEYAGNMSTAIDFEAGLKIGLSGIYRPQKPLFFCASHLMLGLKQTFGPVELGVSFGTFDTFRSEQLQAFMWDNHIRIKLDDRISIKLFYQATFSHGYDELAYIKVHQGGIACTYAD